MRFSDIIGQPVLVNSLRSIIKENKISNGYIFTGPKGCGKKLAASIFACAINCKATDNEKPCGICNSCIKYGSGNHPNIEAIKPTGSSIKIKQIRDIISEVSKTTLESGYKVIIIEEADKMTHEAQDAFLKTLEEPPQSTTFLLLAENQYSLLPTIVSRCQVFTFKRVNNADIEQYIDKRFNVDKDKVRIATALSNGIIGRAIQILQDEAYFSTREAYIKSVHMYSENSFGELSAFLADLITTREAAQAYLEFLIGYFRDILIIKETPEISEEIVINIDKADNLIYYSNILTEHKLNSILDILKDTYKQIGHNMNLKNCMDVMILNIMEVYNGKDNRGKI